MAAPSFSIFSTLHPYTPYPYYLSICSTVVLTNCIVQSLFLFLLLFTFQGFTQTALTPRGFNHFLLWLTNSFAHNFVFIFANPVCSNLCTNRHVQQNPNFVSCNTKKIKTETQNGERHIVTLGMTIWKI